MKLGIMQPYFFPYIGYFQLIHAVDKMVFYVDLPFSCRSWVDRNRLRYRNGSPFFIHAPVVGHSGQIIRDVGFDANESWKKSFFKSLRCNYKAAPYYDEITELLKRVITESGTGEPGSLMRTNVNTLRAIAEYLDIPTKMEARAFAYEDVEERIRALSKEDRMTRRITEICRCNQAENYVNAIGGTALYSKERFLAEGISLSFVSSRAYFYDQQAESFIPDLSIVDALMHCGRDVTKQLVAAYDLI